MLTGERSVAWGAFDNVVFACLLMMKAFDVYHCWLMIEQTTKSSTNQIYSRLVIQLV